MNYLAPALNPLVICLSDLNHLRDFAQVVLLDDDDGSDTDSDSHLETESGSEAESDSDSSNFSVEPGSEAL